MGGLSGELADSGAWEEVPSFLERSRAYAKRAGLIALPVHLDRLDGRAALASGDAAAAADLALEPAIAEFERLRSVREMDAARAVESRLT